MGKEPIKNLETGWVAVLDEEKCSLCEVCANKCPTSALTINQMEDMEELVFDFRLCDDCRGEPLCQKLCPEEAIFIEPAVSLEGSTELLAPAVLMKGVLLKCQDCGTPFVPGKKMETIIAKERVGGKDIQKYCPDCRRKRLLKKFSPTQL
ncbi:MAG: 4Fe-4S binding protein [Acidobacteriota bacterium]